MSKIIGIARTSFTGSNGTQVEGTTLYFTDPIDPKRGQGAIGGKVFLSVAKLAALNFRPAVNQDVQILYNRFGKVASIILVDPLDDGPEVD